MLRFLYNISVGDKLGADWYPIPRWLRAYLSRLPITQKIVVYSRLLKDRDLSFIADDEVGCAESVTRILNTLDNDLCPIITSTWTLSEHIRLNSNRFIEVPYPQDGCIVLAATGTGNGKIRGHVGIYDNGRIWNNNSLLGKWQKSYSLLTFKERYQHKGGFKVRYFLPLDLPIKK